jgi:dihydrofolate reductase
MGNVTLQITMSVDGFVAGPDQSLDEPLGVGGEALHEWVFGTRFFREMTGQDGGEGGLDDEEARRWMRDLGAVIMGRNMFGPVRGPWPDASWRGWWGDNPPYHVPVFVLTHHPRDPITMDGGTTFTFVTDGIAAALSLARDAAGKANVAVAGGAWTARQYLQAGKIDEMTLHVAPLLLGSGERLFDDGDRLPEYECVALQSSPAVARYTFARGR